MTVRDLADFEPYQAAIADIIDMMIASNYDALIASGDARPSSAEQYEDVVDDYAQAARSLHVEPDSNRDDHAQMTFLTMAEALTEHSSYRGWLYLGDDALTLETKVFFYDADSCLSPEEEKAIRAAFVADGWRSTLSCDDIDDVVSNLKAHAVVDGDVSPVGAVARHRRAEPARDGARPSRGSRERP